MQVRLLSAALILLALYLAFGSFFHATLMSSPENFVSQLGQGVATLVQSVRQIVFG